MKLYLQFGHGMKGMCLELIERWNGGTVILSPVNIKENRLKSYSKEFISAGGQVMFDPQLFFPNNANNNLLEYDYWPTQGETMSDKKTNNKIDKEILRINNDISSNFIILPSRQINENNFSNSIKQLNESIKFFRENTDKKILASLPLYPETIRNNNFIEYLCSAVSGLDVDGYYVVPQPPNGEYIVSDGTWSINTLKLLTCLKFTKKKVIVGYSNHQGLIYSLANVDAIASGNFMNTRSFNPNKFKPRTDEPKRKSNWYYVPSAMCEYKAIQLDIAKDRFFLHLFEPQGNFKNDYSNMLFSGARPSSTIFNEPNSFKHYLHCLKIQCDEMKSESYEDAYLKYEFLLIGAENAIEKIRKQGLTGQNRDFTVGIEANRIAMIANNHDYGFKLKLEW